MCGCVCVCFYNQSSPVCGKFANFQSLSNWFGRETKATECIKWLKPASVRYFNLEKVKCLFFTIFISLLFFYMNTTSFYHNWHQYYFGKLYQNASCECGTYFSQLTACTTKSSCVFWVSVVSWQCITFSQQPIQSAMRSLYVLTVHL